MMFSGFAGIFGFSARFTGGGGPLAGDIERMPEGAAVEMILSGLLSRVSTPAPGDGGLVDALLEFADINSLTLLKGVTSTRSGDRDRLLPKKVRGGDFGDSTLTAGVNCGEEPICIDIGRL